MSTLPVTTEVLLSHTGWLQRLALRLVRDASRADDVVQQTLFQALRHPPRDAVALRGWLARVARNEARQIGRSEGARARREQRVGRPRTADPTSDVVERAEMHRRVVDAVFGLEEPYRTVVLLRYFDGLEPKAIAAHLEWPAATVRTRLHRGLERLRVAMDEQAGGDRRGWAFGLMAIVDWNEAARAGAGGALAGAAGGAIVSTKVKAILVAAVLLVLVLGRPLFLGQGDDDEQPVSRPPTLARGSDDVNPPLLEGRDAHPEPIARAPPVAPPASPAPAAQLRFTDGTGRSLVIADVARRYSEAGMGREILFVSKGVLSRTEVAAAFVRRMTGSDEGRFAAAWAVTPEGLRIPLELGTWRLFVGRPGAPPLLTEAFGVLDGESAPTIDIPLPTEAPMAFVRLVTADTEAPLACAVVVPFFEYGDDLAFFEGPALRADADGEVQIPVRDPELQSPRGRGATWWAIAPGRAARVPAHVAHMANTDAVTVFVPRTATIAGKAWRQDGQPAAGLDVVWTRKGLTRRTTVGKDGTFRLEGVPADRQTRQIYLLEDPSTMRIGGARIAVQPGETADASIGSAATEGARGAVVGRITAGGVPVEGAIVFARPDGASRRDGAMARTDAEGRYRLDGEVGLMEFSAMVGGTDDFFIRSVGLLDLAPEERTMDFDLPGGTLRVRVVDADTGEPVPGAEAYAAPEQRGVAEHRFEGFVYQAGWIATASEDGAALLRALVPGEPHQLRAGAEGYERFSRDGVLPARAGEEPIEITVRLKKR